MGDREVIDVKTNNAGSTAGILSCVFSVLGIVTFSVVFIPLAAILAIFGLLSAILQMNISGIGLNLFAWLLVVIGIITSPVLIAFFIMLAGLMHIAP